MKKQVRRIIIRRTLEEDKFPKRRRMVAEEEKWLQKNDNGCRRRIRRMANGE